MGIRYYAYPLDKREAERAVADPLSAFSSDPLADAWGLEPGASIGRANLDRRSSWREMLYLDKAWRHLQILSMPQSHESVARPAYRMFEGNVTTDHDCSGWEPWLRAIAPEEVPEIVNDLELINHSGMPAFLHATACLGPDPDPEISYAGFHFAQALEFAAAMRDDGRGLVYMIG